MQNAQRLQLQQMRTNFSGHFLQFALGMSYVDNYVESFDHIMDNIKVAKDNFE